MADKSIEVKIWVCWFRVFLTKNTSESLTRNATFDLSIFAHHHGSTYVVVIRHNKIPLLMEHGEILGTFSTAYLGTGDTIRRNGCCCIKVPLDTTDDSNWFDFQIWLLVIRPVSQDLVLVSTLIHVSMKDSTWLMVLCVRHPENIPKDDLDWK